MIFGRLLMCSKPNLFSWHCFIEKEETTDNNNQPLISKNFPKKGFQSGNRH